MKRTVISLHTPQSCTKNISRRIRATAYILLFALAVSALSLGGCTPRFVGASAQGFHGNGLPNFSIGVSEPLQLCSTGAFGVFVPSDVNTNPRAQLGYALFAKEDSGAITRHVHTMFTELPPYGWRWEMETWAKKESLSYMKREAAGKHWTMQVFPVVAAGDWFSDMWVANGKSIPEFWLAKRWSATPDDQMRVLAEYREPAPECMRERLAPLAQHMQVDGKSLRYGCEKEVEAFMQRADATIGLERNTPPAEGLLSPRLIRPQSRPDMGKLVGRADYIEPNDNYYRD